MAVGVVHERDPGRSVYNLLCDLEWRGPLGEVQSCGGNSMVRVRALREVRGFNPGLIAGEEPELALRLQRAGWRIVRFDEPMVEHDAAMIRFSQWWMRALRGGWGYAEGAALHAGSPERFWRRENASILFWGMLVPGVALLLAWPTHGATLLLLAGHVLLFARIRRRGLRAGLSRREARLQAFFTVLGKLPQGIGHLEFSILRLLRRRRNVIDWRDATRLRREISGEVRQPH